MSTSFEPGAPAEKGSIPLCVPEIRGNEWRYLKECLDANFVSSVGPFVDRFERDIAACVGARHAVATVNGTAALHVALLVAGVLPDDEVIVPTLTFIAPANAVRYVGAWPVLVDAEPEYGQMDLQQVERFLVQGCGSEGGKTINKATGRCVKAVIPVHVLGHPVDMDPLVEIARKFHLVVVEDATESLGARYKDRSVGHLGDIACFSFNGNKVITSGGGGMIVTDNGEWAKKAKYLTTQAKDDPVEYVHNEIGFNYRMTNIQAAVGCAQLEQLDQFVARKREMASVYASRLAGLPGVSMIGQASWAQSIFWMSTIRLDPSRARMGSRDLLAALRRENIQSRPLWRPLHLNRPYAGMAFGACPVAAAFHSEALSLPCSVGLTDRQQAIVASTVRGMLQ